MTGAGCARLGLAAVAVAMMSCGASATQQEVPAAGSGCADRLAPAADEAEVRPLVVLVERNPWAAVIGSDSPRFALYSDGLVIYRREDGFRSVRLDPRELEALRERLDVPVLGCALGRHGPENLTDQPEEDFHIGRGGALSLISVYGAIEPGRAPQGTPRQVVAAYATLTGFAHPRAQPWMPERVEVMIWPYEHARSATRWPAGWPTLTSPGTMRRGESYSLFVAAADYPRVSSFLRASQENGAIEIDGRKWSAATRFPFPLESHWMRPRQR